MKPRRCVICDAPMPMATALDAATCGALRCAWIDRTLAPDRRCSTCTRPLKPEQLARGHCGEPACRDRHHERQRVVTRARLAAQASRLLVRLQGSSDPDVPIVHLPVLDGRSTRLPARRRVAFRRHLQSIARGETTDVPAPPRPPESPAPSDEMTRALRTGCATCGGHCCSFGNTHAYLRAETFERIRADHPGLDDGEIIARYIDALPEVSIRGSCVYHTRHGCALERAWRADLCNDFYCAGLSQYRRERNSGPPLPVFFAASDGKQVIRGTLLTATATRSATAATDC